MVVGVSVWRKTGDGGREGDQLSYLTCVGTTDCGVLMVASILAVASQVAMR